MAEAAFLKGPQVPRRGQVFPLGGRGAARGADGPGDLTGCRTFLFGGERSFLHRSRPSAPTSGRRGADGHRRHPRGRPGRDGTLRRADRGAGAVGRSISTREGPRATRSRRGAAAALGERGGRPPRTSHRLIATATGIAARGRTRAAEAAPLAGVAGTFEGGKSEVGDRELCAGREGLGGVYRSISRRGPATPGASAHAKRRFANLPDCAPVRPGLRSRRWGCGAETDRAARSQARRPLRGGRLTFPDPQSGSRRTSVGGSDRLLRQLARQLMGRRGAGARLVRYR